jgi:hypothetical protein
MICWYLTTVDGQAQSSRTDFQKSCGFGEIQPCTCIYLVIAGDAMMTAQCCDPFSCPAITAACQMPVSIQDAAMTSSLEMRANTTTASINSREVCVLH